MGISDITPGEILKEEYLDPMGLSQNGLARQLDVSPRTINEIVLGRRSITAKMSIWLGTYFRQSARFWLNIQTECDLRAALANEAQLTKHIEPYPEVAENTAEYNE